MSIRHAVLGGMAVAAWAFLAGQARALDIPITVTEPAGVARTAAPASGGIPLPAGQFQPGQPFALFDGHRGVPVQVLPLVLDKDGSLRWVLVDFQTDLKPGEKKSFTLKAAKPTAAPASPLKVTETADAVTIDTGRMTLAISKSQPFALFDAVTVNGRPVVARGGSISYTDGFDGKTYASSVPDSVQVEYAGPLRTTVCVRGRFVGDEQTKMRYVARITAWAGSSRVHVKHSLSNSNPDQFCWRVVKDSSIELRLAGQPSASIVGAGKPIETGPDAWLAQALRANVAGSGKAGSGDKALWVSPGGQEVAQGWLAARLGEGCVQVADLYFAYDPARRLALKGGVLTLSGAFERWQGEADEKGNEVGKPYNLTARVLPDCTHLSSEYLLDFAAPADPADLSATAKAGLNRVHLRAEPEWYLHRTDALPFGRFGTQADEIACYDAWGWKYDPKDAPTQPSVRERYWPHMAGTDAHYTPEEDVTDQLLIMYLRTGSRSYFDYAHGWVNYAMDVYAWRTDGWRFKDGGVWWYGGPKGNAPVRAADPITGNRNSIPAAWAKEFKEPWTKPLVDDMWFVTNAKGCYCHNWAEGLAHWFLLTGDRDALEAAIDRVEQDYSHLSTAQPGKTDSFSRNFNRASYNAHAVRMAVPGDEFVTKVSDFMARCYLSRPSREPHGLVNPAGWNWYQIVGGELFRADGREQEKKAKLDEWLKTFVGEQGIEALAQSGVKVDYKTGELVDPKTGGRWQPVVAPHTWMYPPLSRAMECYYRLTGNEDAMDWTIAYGQAAARLIYQRHTTLTYDKLLVDFPVRGVSRDWASWATAPDNRYAEGVKLSGFLARFHPDVCARAYTLSGEPLLKGRACDFWFGGSHRGYQTDKIAPPDRVARWVNHVSDHDGQVDFVLRTFYEWSHPRADDKAPAAVTDLAVSANGDKATVTFTAPADAGGGKAVCYQVKCSDKPIVDYVAFIKHFNDWTDEKVTNWWMAANLAGEPAPQAAGAKESFTLTAVPAGAKFFAIVTFDDSVNRSAISNLAEAK